MNDKTIIGALTLYMHYFQTSESPNTATMKEEIPFENPSEPYPMSFGEASPIEEISTTTLNEYKSDSVMPNLPQMLNVGTMHNLSGMSLHSTYLTMEESKLIENLSLIEKNAPLPIDPADGVIVQSCLYSGNKIPDYILCNSYVVYLERMLKVAISYEQFNQ